MADIYFVEENGTTETKTTKSLSLVSTRPRPGHFTSFFTFSFVSESGMTDSVVIQGLVWIDYHDSNRYFVIAA